MSRIIALIAFCALPFISAGCEKVPLLAPTGSTIFLTLGETTNLGLNATVQVTAVVTEQGGTPPQNGTVVTFTTTLGSVNPIEARTTNGIAGPTFNTGTRSGTATLRAFSGGAGTGESTAEASVAIGGGGENTFVSLRAEGIANSGTSTAIVATVLDGAGNPISAIQVTFSATTGLVSPGVVTSDGNGEARTTLTTSATSEVTARAGGTTSSAFTINAPGSLALAFGTGSTSPVEVGQPVNYVVTPAGTSFFSNVAVDFGDGTPIQNLGAVSGARSFVHTFTQRGSFTVTATGISTTGTTSSSLGIQVNDRAAVGVALTATPNPVTLTAQQGLVAFSATPTFPTGTALSRVDWTFGDGQSERSTSLTANHRYTATGTYSASVVVTANDGRQGSGTITIRVIAP